MHLMQLWNYPWYDWTRSETWSYWSLTHWGWVTHICIGKLTIIGSDNGLSPGRHQAIIWTNAGILLIGPLVTNFSEILIEIHTFSFKKTHLKISSGKWQPFCLGLNVLRHWEIVLKFGEVMARCHGADCYSKWPCSANFGVLLNITFNLP